MCTIWKNFLSFNNGSHSKWRGCGVLIENREGHKNYPKVGKTRKQTKKNYTADSGILLIINLYSFNEAILNIVMKKKLSS